MSAPVDTLAWKRLVRRFARPLKTAAGEFTRRESLILRLVDAEGRVGFGEVAPWPGFPVETLEAAEDRLALGADAPFDTEALAAAGLPCLAGALGAARLWSSENHGARSVSLPSAGLLRDLADHAEARAKLASGFVVLKLKIGRDRVRDEQRAVAGLVRAVSGVSATTRLRLDANGALDVGATAAWCDFLSEYPEVEWLEQPMPPGHEAVVRENAATSGVADRIALDESACSLAHLPADWPGILAVKPALLGDPAVWRTRRDAYPRVAYASVFESPFGRQSALVLASEDSRAGFAVGFDTLGAFDDALEVHAPGPVATTVARDPAFWDALWARI